MLLELKDEKTFEAITRDKNVSVVHFQADWADQCVQVNELLEALKTQNDYSDLKFYCCQAEDLSEISLKYKIEAVPTVVLYRSGKVLEVIQGADSQKITETIKKYSRPYGETAHKPVSVEERIKTLLSKSKIMLFMKGDRNEPRCGFSRQIVDILNKTGKAYETFDILTDEDIRQGLKTYSDWPTYPQLYVNRELIGGLDIVKELLSGDELISALEA